MKSLLSIVSGVCICCSLAACSVQQLAIRSMADALAEGNSVFAADDDPAFIEQALPFSLKLIDALLLEQPDNERLLLAAASGYVFYGYAYLALPAERVSRDDLDRALELRARARNLFMRAHAYANHALDQAYQGAAAALLDDPQTAISMVGSQPERDVELLYWAAAALGLAISSSRNEPALLARSAEVEALLNRALVVDESWDRGALHEFAINFAGVSRASRAEIRSHFDRALDLSRGQRASLFVSYAEATAIPDQDRQAFIDLLDRALTVELDANPDLRLVNVVAQQRASWLMRNLDDIFLE